MWFKCSLIYFWVFILISGDKSFTIVLDTTTSMQEELDIIKVNLPSALNATNNKDITNYVLVPFNDPDVGEPTVVSTPSELLSSINGITVSGGHKCPENSLAGIEKALQISRPQSNIFVFTDAYSKDADKFNSVQNLCRSTRSQVVIFLSGFCSVQSSPTANEQVYYDIARACSGAVVYFDISTLRQAFKYIKEVSNVEWTDVISYDTFTEYKELSFTVDSFTKTMLLVVSGDNPKVDVSTPNYSNVAVEKILDSRHTQVVRLTEPSIGDYKATIRCQNKTSVVLYKQYELPLRFGFSTKLPRSMNETSRKPMPGRTNKILIDASQSNMKLESIEKQVANEKEKKALVFEQNSNTGLYLTDTFIEPDKVFCIWVKGYDTSTNQEIKATSEDFIPQKATATESRWTKPQSEILDATEPLIDYGKNLTFACKVTGYPTPNIVWEDDNGVILPSESALLEIPSLYISYVSIENVTANSTITCKSTNSEGDDSQSLNLYVYRPYTFDVIETPADPPLITNEVETRNVTVKEEDDVVLPCEVKASPKANVRWEMTQDDVIIALDDRHHTDHRHTHRFKALWKDSGNYHCIAENSIGTAEKTVTVNVLVAPYIEAPKSKTVVTKTGQNVVLTCNVLFGNPAPSTKWEFIAPDSTTKVLQRSNSSSLLHLNNVSYINEGSYLCIADNLVGTDSINIYVKIQ